jgi:hypothetical protein
LNSSYADVLKIFEVYDFIPDELNKFLSEKHYIKNISDQSDIYGKLTFADLLSDKI